MGFEKRFSIISQEIKETKRYIQEKVLKENRIDKSIKKYFISFQGKMIRPIICILSAYSVSPEVDKKKLITLSGAIELIHNSSLLHDDTIDKAVKRRGKKTMWYQWNREVAMLFGDALFSISMKIIIEEFPSLASDIASTVVQMCSAEVEHHRRRNDFTLTEEDYIEILRGKTGSLTAVASASGARIAGYDRDIFHKYGENLGVAYQILDDLLDFTLDDSDKSTGLDIKEGLITLPVIYLKNEGYSPGDMWNNRKKIIPKCIKKAETFIQKAKASLTEIQESPYKRLLIDIPEYFISATYNSLKVNRKI